MARTFSSPQLQAQHIVGAADGAVTVTHEMRLAGYDAHWLAEPFSTASGPRRDPASVDLASLLPRGTRIAAMPRFQPVDVVSDRGIVRMRILLGDGRQPLQRFLLTRASGSRLPRAGEVLVTRSLAVRLDLLDGDGRLRSNAAIDLVDGLSARVAGLALDPQHNASARSCCGTSAPTKPVNLVLSLIAAVAAFTTLVGVVVSTALSVAESRADLATLAAIGAPPGRRRALTACHALLIGGLGSLLGTALGAFIAFAARTTTGSPRLVVPWPELTATTVGVPLLAALVAAAFTPRHAPMLRRAE